VGARGASHLAHHRERRFIDADSHGGDRGDGVGTRHMVEKRVERGARCSSGAALLSAGFWASCIIESNVFFFEEMAVRLSL
jgi:hypothetical protein